MAGVDDANDGEVVAVESGGEVEVGRSVMVTQRRRGGGASHRFSAALLDRIRVRNVGGENGGYGEPRTQCPGPHLPLYSAARWGPTNHDWVGTPDQGADQRPKLAYRFDTSIHEWSEVGKWTLPFQGKVEYVPELNLWFGFCAKDHHFAAADLSSTVDMEDSQQPQLLDSWQELEPPVLQEEGWQQTQDPQLVNLGSGRFGITRFLCRALPNLGLLTESHGLL